MRDWVRVSRGAPCPICFKPDWCTLAGDGSAACCMRTESERRMGNGGWLHRLGRDMLGAHSTGSTGSPQAGSLLRQGSGGQAGQAPARQYLSPGVLGKTWARWAASTADAQVDGLAGRLGVKAAALRALGACWAWPHEAWGFPMFDGGEEFAGIRLRSDDGDKWALRGSRQGIFIPDMKPQGETLIVEGPTDAAAAVSLGFYAIGRASCTGGAREIGVYCRRRGVKRVSVLADNDSPGISGARALCGQLGIAARLVVLPAKDLREWVKNGATRQAVEACLAAHAWRA